MLESKLIHVSKKGPVCLSSYTTATPTEYERDMQ